MKTVIVLRACSNAGKSTFAQYLQQIKQGEKVVICSADDYFYRTGEYKFNVQELSVAHGECQRKYINAVNSGNELIIIANTNTTPKEFQFYIDAAENRGYMVFSVILEKRHPNVNTHQCPEFTIVRQSENIKNNLQLF
jgi:predicted kinase